MTLLVVENLGKAYRTFDPEWHRFLTWLGAPLKPSGEHWVLRHIHFSIGPGEALGIVGQNGAGKSTLLKLITGTLQPSEGAVRNHGRISAILELGLGFNGELSGRQNAIHVAGLMGAPIDEIKAAIPEIEAFAEIGDYFEEPVRTYSSGMQARLAFSVATAFRPDILIVDEVLAVGDAYFIHKCNQRIREFREAGTSLLVVAHDREAIQTLCNRVILLDKGACLMDGEPEPVMDFYNALIAERENATIRQQPDDHGRIKTLSGTGEARLSSLRIEDERGDAIEWIPVGQTVFLIAHVEVFQAVSDLVFGYQIKDCLGRVIFGTNTHHLKEPIKHLKNGDHIELSFRFAATIGVGSYSISTALHTGDTHIEYNYEWRDFALMFNMHNPNQRAFIGVNWLPPEAKVTRC